MVFREDERDRFAGEPGPGSPEETDSGKRLARRLGGGAGVHPCRLPPHDRGEVVRRLRHLIPAMESRRASKAPAATFDIPEIDGRFPGGGLSGGALHEAAPATIDDAAAALGFAVALLARSPAARGPLLFVASQSALGDRVLYGHGLKGLGLEPDRLTLVETRTDADALWALEEALRSRAVKGIAGFVGRDLDLKASRRLHLAAGASDVLFLLLRPPDGAGASAAATRWRVAASGAGRDRFGCLETPRWRLALERCRNGRSGEWSVEWDHGANRFGMVGALADRALLAGPEPERRRAGHRP